MKKRKDGRYPKNAKINGKPKYLYSTAKTEKQAEKDFKQQIRDFKEKEEKGKLFKEVAEEWENDHYEQLAYTTEQRYKPLVRYAVEYYDGIYIKDMQPYDVLRFMKFKIKKGFASKTVSHQMSVLNMICEYACIEGYIQSNPCQYIRVPNNLPRKKRLIPSVEDIERIKANYDKPFGLLAYFILYTGLRKGETVAIDSEDFNFEKRIIHINKSVYYKSNKPYLKKPKTAAGERDTVLLDCLAEKLPRRKSGLLFPNKYGKHMTHSEFAQGWKRYQKETGVTATPQQLRHAYASYILHDSGIDPKTAQGMLGHADISTTNNIYTQITEMQLAAAAKTINTYTRLSKNCQQPQD